MNKQEAIAVIKEEVLEKGEHPEYGADYSKLEAAGFTVGVAEQVGGEGEGSHTHVVLTLEKENEKTFVKCDGYYQSYEGTTFGSGYGDVYEVIPKKIEVQDWAKV